MAAAKTTASERESEPGDSPAREPALALSEWLANRDTSLCTHRVRTCYSWDRAWALEREGWKIDTAGWQKLAETGKGGWVILLSQPITEEKP